MSNPSFENIDKWLFEYVEGNLSPKQITQLETFLLNNPEFEADLDAWQFAKVDSSPVEFPGFAGRKRRIVPFWISATLVLSAVFVAGGLTGAYLTLPADQERNVQVESAASTTNYTAAIRPITLNASRAEIERKTSSQNSSKTANSTFVSNSVLNAPLKEKRAGVSKRAETKISLESTSLKKSNSILEDQNKFVLYDESFTKSEDENLTTTVPIIEDDVMSANSKEVISDNAIETYSNKSDEVESKSDKNVSSSNTIAAMTRGDRITSNYSNSFQSKMKSTMRKIVRMTENPIALTNSKDVYYHIPGMQTLNVNAATAGNLLRPRIQSVTRAQWTGQSNQQLFNELSFDTYVRSIRGGIGVQVNHSYYNQGTYNVGQIALTYSPKFTVNKNFTIEPGIRVKMGDKRLNAQNLVQGQIIEMERGNEKIFFNETPQNLIKDLWYKDVALALNTNTKWFSVGFQMDNLGRHSNNVYNSLGQNDRAGIHYTAHLSTDFISRSKVFSFSPYLMCQKVENLSEIWGGSILRYNKLTFGGAFSSGGDYAASIGLKTKQFMLTYNADMTHSYLTGTRLFSQQLTIRLLMNKGFYGRTTLKQ
jgi:hypothetical protein